MTAVAVLVGWLAGTVLLWRMRTPPPITAPSAQVAATSVIIPARDEAGALPALLASLAAQNRPPLDVVVVDDGSTDRTSVVAAAAGATVVPAGAPPAGWLGKPWACHQGVLAASGTRLVFLDADTRLAADALERLVAAHDAGAGDGLLSVQPYHEVRRAYEQLSAFANVVPVLASGMARAGRTSPWGPLQSVAFGPCLVTTRDALEAVGGFAAVRSSIVEDLALARAYRAAGRPVRCLGGGSSVRFRMYPDGVRSLIEGWTKNLAVGASQAPPLSTIAAVAWVLAVAGVGAAGLMAVARWLLGGGTPPLAVVLAWVAVSAQLWWMLRRLGSFRWWCWVVFPVPLAAFTALFLRSLVVRVSGRPVMWRGRRIEARSGVR
ncbi:MAG: glycosyltransferase [Acidimicrobiales bacterium]